MTRLLKNVPNLMGIEPTEHAALILDLEICIRDVADLKGDKLLVTVVVNRIEGVSDNFVIHTAEGSICESQYQLALRACIIPAIASKLDELGLTEGLSRMPIILENQDHPDASGTYFFLVRSILYGVRTRISEAINAWSGHQALPALASPNVRYACRLT